MLLFELRKEFFASAHGGHEVAVSVAVVYTSYIDPELIILQEGSGDPFGAKGGTGYPSFRGVCRGWPRASGACPLHVEYAAGQWSACDAGHVAGVVAE